MLAAVIAMAFYALEIAITDVRLSQVPARYMTLFYAAGVALISLVSLAIHREPLQVSGGGQLVFFIGLMVLVSFIAATAHFAAINQGFGTARLTLMYALMPVVASFYMALFKHEWPSIYLIGAWCLAAGALFLVSLTQRQPV